jgi:hypothetical protein
VRLVDTTVWIDFFRGASTPHVEELERLINDHEDVCICGVILTEILQGIRDDTEHQRVLSSLRACVLLPMTEQTFLSSAELYRTARRRGFTIRNSVDCMIAAVAIEHDVTLLHHDRDFDTLARISALKITGTGKPTRPRTVRRVRGLAAGEG